MVMSGLYGVWCNTATGVELASMASLNKREELCIHELSGAK